MVASGLRLGTVCDVALVRSRKYPLLSPILILPRTFMVAYWRAEAVVAFQKYYILLPSNLCKPALTTSNVRSFAVSISTAGFMQKANRCAVAFASGCFRRPCRSRWFVSPFLFPKSLFMSPGNRLGPGVHPSVSVLRGLDCANNRPYGGSW